MTSQLPRPTQHIRNRPPSPIAPAVTPYSPNVSSESHHRPPTHRQQSKTLLPPSPYKSNLRQPKLSSSSRAVSSPPTPDLHEQRYNSTESSPPIHAPRASPLRNVNTTPTLMHNHSETAGQSVQRMLTPLTERTEDGFSVRPSPSMLSRAQTPSVKSLDERQRTHLLNSLNSMVTNVGKKDYNQALSQVHEVNVLSQVIDLPALLRLHKKGGEDITPTSSQHTDGHVFGTPLKTSIKYASCSTVVSGRRHDIPIIVFGVIEELYSRGMSFPHLFAPSSKRPTPALELLIKYFNSPPTYGDDDDGFFILRQAPVTDLCALLTRYISSLPRPILDRTLFKAFWEFCILPPAASPTRTTLNQEESQIASAQILLRLLPKINFSLLIYLLAFLAQIPLFPANGLSYGDLAKIFGPSMISPSRGQGGRVGAEEDMMSQSIMLWLLVHWDTISDGLFFDDEVEDGVRRRSRSSEYLDLGRSDQGAASKSPPHTQFPRISGLSMHAQPHPDRSISVAESENALGSILDDMEVDRALLLSTIRRNSDEHDVAMSKSRSEGLSMRVGKSRSWNGNGLEDQLKRFIDGDSDDVDLETPDSGVDDSPEPLLLPPTTFLLSPSDVREFGLQAEVDGLKLRLKEVEAERDAAIEKLRKVKEIVSPLLRAK